MDDLYQNAWSETADTVTATFNHLNSSEQSWSSPSPFAGSHDEEADLAAPSWSTGTGIQWNEPGSPSFSWSQSDADAGWGASTYEGISLGKPSTEVEQTTQSSPTRSISSAQEVHEAHDQDASITPPQSPTSRLPPSPLVPSSTPITESAQTQVYELRPDTPNPPSPDGFGSFETGFVEDSAPLSEPAVNISEPDPWGASAWADTSHHEDEEPVDEWERAKQEKAKQDRHVPPELLADILRQCEELCRDIPEQVQEDTQAYEKDAWRNDRRSGMEGVPGLNDLMETFLPPLTLRPPPRFAQAVVTKKMATSVKLTKNLSITRGSPMAHYLSAKGSIAWEVSVKERKEVIEDDVPVGWRIVEKTHSASTAETAKDKKSGGGLFSFWGRRQSQIPVSNSAHSRSSSMEKPQSPVAVEESGSKRPSQDSVRSFTSGSAKHVSPMNEQPPQSMILTETALPSMSSYATASDSNSDRSGSPSAPSAVSRFLNRFSRHSSVGGSPRSSLALSSDDIEFLADVVPSAADDEDEDATDALEKFMNVKKDVAVPVLPPPLNPPPRTTPFHATGRPSSVVPASSAAIADDFGELFGPLASDSLPRAPVVPAEPSKAPHSVPRLAPPLVPSRPHTPSSPPSGTDLSRTTITLSSTPLSTLRSTSRTQMTTPPLPAFGLPPPPPPASKPGAPSKDLPTTSKPALPLSLNFPRANVQTESEPMSASSTSSASYQTAAESSPSSPTSSLPLGELYPHLVSPVSPPQPSAQALFPDQDSTQPSSLATPVGKAFSSSSNSPFLRFPTPGANRPSLTAAPLSSNLFEDDGFSDFHSPADHLATSSPSAPSPIAKSPRTLAAAKAANVVGVSTTRSQVGTLATFDDDDFSDFQDSPISSASSHPSSSSSLFANASDKALLTPKNSMNFAGFDDFLSSSLATPSPPRVPAKPVAVPPLQPPSGLPPLLQPPPLQPPPRQGVPTGFPPLQSLSNPQLQSSRLSSPTQVPSASSSMPSVSSGSSSASLLARRESKKKSHQAEHLHTLNLVEKAAARSGQQWPAPPSPLPAAIPGPVGAPRRDSVSLFDIMDEDTPAAGVPLAPSFSSPAVMNPLRPSSRIGIGDGSSTHTSMGMGLMVAQSSSPSSPPTDSLASLWSSNPTKANVSQATHTPFTSNGVKAESKAPTSIQGSGLSAQDLSFFEGL